MEVSHVMELGPPNDPKSSDSPTKGRQVRLRRTFFDGQRSTRCQSAGVGAPPTTGKTGKTGTRVADPRGFQKCSILGGWD